MKRVSYDDCTVIYSCALLARYVFRSLHAVPPSPDSYSILILSSKPTSVQSESFANTPVIRFVFCKILLPGILASLLATCPFCLATFLITYLFRFDNVFLLAIQLFDACQIGSRKCQSRVLEHLFSKRDWTT
jgi:hypothetical protein